MCQNGDAQEPLVSESPVQAELSKRLHGRPFGRWSRVVLSALGGIPWAGSLLGAASTFWAERAQNKTDELLMEWLRLMQEQLDRVKLTLGEIIARLDPIVNIDDRINGPDYLDIVRKAFHHWSAGTSEQKREYVRNLLTHAAASRICSDDVVKLFIEWIQKYNELHFRVIRELFKDPGLTRLEIWDRMHGEPAREDSAEADLFKLLINDLTLGHVIRHHRETDGAGRFLRNRPQKASRTPYMKSAFDDDKECVLTALGRQFVHYTMEDLVPQISGGESKPQ